MVRAHTLTNTRTMHTNIHPLESKFTQVCVWIYFFLVHAPTSVRVCVCVAVGLGFCLHIVKMLLLLLLTTTHQGGVRERERTVKPDSHFSASSVINVKNHEQHAWRCETWEKTNTMDVMPGTRILNAESAAMLCMIDAWRYKKNGKNGQISQFSSQWR